MGHSDNHTKREGNPTDTVHSGALNYIFYSLPFYARFRCLSIDLNKHEQLACWVPLTNKSHWSSCTACHWFKIYRCLSNLLWPRTTAHRYRPHCPCCANRMHSPSDLTARASDLTAHRLNTQTSGQMREPLCNTDSVIYVYQIHCIFVESDLLGVTCLHEL